MKRGLNKEQYQKDNYAQHTLINSIMKFKIFHIDAFTSQVFKGNPAAVVPLETWLPKELMQKIAFENNLPETAFFVKEGEGYSIKWFTPTTEVDLCGHATLASAFVIYHFYDNNIKEINFNSNSGILQVTSSGDLITLNFPATLGEEVEAPSGMILGLGSVVPSEVYKVNDDYMAILDSEGEVKKMVPDFSILKKINARGIIVTARGNDVDFVSRFFAPQSGIDEDPVTGSSHTKLIPYWASMLEKNELTAKQISERGGELWCKLNGDRVEISGHAKLYLQGEIEV